MGLVAFFEEQLCPGGYRCIAGLDWRRWREKIERARVKWFRHREMARRKTSIHLQNRGIRRTTFYRDTDDKMEDKAPGNKAVPDVSTKVSTQENTLNKTYVRWIYVALYYGIALAISLPFNSRILAQTINLQAAVAPAWKAWLFAPAALGPLIAAFVCYRFDRSTQRRMSLFGQDRVASCLTALVPLVAFTIAGSVSGLAARESSGWLPAVSAACLALLYSLGEEAGWRGYLQDALVPLSINQRYLLVGVLWWAWHARFSNVFEWTLFPLIVIASAFLLGRVAEETRSLLVVASMHSVIMLLTMNGSVSIVQYGAGILTILGWILIRRFRSVQPAQVSQVPDEMVSDDPKNPDPSGSTEDSPGFTA